MNTDCPQLASVSSFVDDELREEERAALLQHMKDCGICSRELEDLKRLRAALGNVSADPLARQRVLASLPLDPGVPRFARRQIAVPLPLAAAILLILGISVLANAYLGFRQHAGGREAEKGMNLGVAQGRQLPPESVASLARTADRASLPGTDIPGRSGNNSATASAATDIPAPAAKPIVVMFESGQKTIEIITTTEYRLNSSPHIYVGGYSYPQSERQQP